MVDVERGEGVQAHEELGAQVPQLVAVQGQVVQAVHACGQKGWREIDEWPISLEWPMCVYSPVVHMSDD